MTKRIPVSALTLAAVLVLSACGQGSPVSVSSESSAGSDSDARTSWDRTQDISLSKTSRMTISMPAMAFLGSVTQALCPALAWAGGDFAASFTYGGLSAEGALALLPRLMAITGFKPDVKEITPEIKKWAASESARLDKLQAEDRPAEIDYVIDLQRAYLKKINAGDFTGAKADIEAFNIHALVLSSLFVAQAPSRGSRLAERNNSNGNERTFIPREFFTWLYSALHIARFSNGISAELLPLVSRTTLRDPGQARMFITQVLFTMPVDKIKSIAADVQLPSKQLDISVVPGPLKSDLILSINDTGEYFSQTQAGLTIERSGQPWFGKEFVNAKKYEITMDSSTATSESRRKATTSSESTKEGTSERAGISVK